MGAICLSTAFHLLLPQTTRFTGSFKEKKKKSYPALHASSFLLSSLPSSYRYILSTHHHYHTQTSMEFFHALGGGARFNKKRFAQDVELFSVCVAGMETLMLHYSLLSPFSPLCSISSPRHPRMKKRERTRPQKAHCPRSRRWLDCWMS